MLLAFLSSRIRSWLVFAVVLPLAGRLLQAVGGRVADRNPRAGNALTSAGGYARQPFGRRNRPKAVRRKRSPRA